MEQHVQEAASRNASQRGDKVYNSCICLPGNALVQDNKKEGRIICCAQVLRDFWVDLLSLHDVNKTYLNATAFAFLGQGCFAKTAERHLGDGGASMDFTSGWIRGLSNLLTAPRSLPSHMQHKLVLLYFGTDYWDLLIQCSWAVVTPSGTCASTSFRRGPKHTGISNSDHKTKTEMSSQGKW